MDILFLLIPLGLALVGVISWFFIWSVNHRQFETWRDLRMRY